MNVPRSPSEPLASRYPKSRYSSAARLTTHTGPPSAILTPSRPDERSCRMEVATRQRRVATVACPLMGCRSPVGWSGGRDRTTRCAPRAAPRAAYLVLLQNKHGVPRERAPGADLLKRALADQRAAARCTGVATSPSTRGFRLRPRRICSADSHRDPGIHSILARGIQSAPLSSSSQTARCCGVCSQRDGRSRSASSARGDGNVEVDGGGPVSLVARRRRGAERHAGRTCAARAHIVVAVAERGRGNRFTR